MTSEEGESIDIKLVMIFILFCFSEEMITWGSSVGAVQTSAKIDSLDHYPRRPIQTIRGRDVPIGGHRSPDPEGPPHEPKNNLLGLELAIDIEFMIGGV